MTTTAPQPPDGRDDQDLQALVAAQQDTIDDLVAAMALMQRSLATLNRRMANLERASPRFSSTQPDTTSAQPQTQDPPGPGW